VNAVGKHLRAAAGGFPAAYWWLWGGMLLNRIGGFVLPFLSLYLTREQGFPPERVGLFVSLYGAGIIAAGPLGGLLADRVGRRFTMALSCTGGGLLAIAFGFLRGPGWIALATLLLGLVGEMYRPAMQAAVGDLVPPGDRVRAFGLVYWAVNLGFAIGLSLAGLLASSGLRLLFVLDGLTSLLFAGIVLLRVGETRPPLVAGQRPRARLGGRLAELLAAWRDDLYVAFLGLYLLFLLFFSQIFTTLPLDMTLHGISPGGYGFAMSMNGIVIVLVQPLAGPVLRRLNPSRVLAAGALVAGLGFGANALAGTTPQFAAASAIWTLGEIMTLPVSNAIAVELAPTDLRGRYQGALSTCWGVAGLASPPLGTVVLARLGGGVLWGSTLVLGLLASAGHLALARRLHARLGYSPR
jgi:MFS family permease